MILQKTVEFIRTAKEVHGDMYDYSKVVYDNNLKEVVIICQVHGEFEQLPKTHKRGNGCLACGRLRTGAARKSDTGEFLRKANQVHGDNKYDYSESEYVKAAQKITIICRAHGRFMQTPNGHLDGAGCKKCAVVANSDKKRKSNEIFIEEAKAVHRDGLYDYRNVCYTNNYTNVTIICKDHGMFEQSPSNHLAGKGCPDCGLLSRAAKRTKDTETFIEEAIRAHGDKFDYSKTVYEKCDTEVVIICRDHGEFRQVAHNHLPVTQWCSPCPECLALTKGKWNKSCTEEFIAKARSVHGEKYDYSKVDYDKANLKVIIVCDEHGEFQQTPNSHLNDSGCPSCGMIMRANAQTLSQTEFVAKAIDIHGVEKYDYSHTTYINYTTEIDIVCKEHGVFSQTPAGHLAGKGCIKCSGKYSYSPEEWILKAKEVHGDVYDYTRTRYTSANINVVIICRIHGEFEQIPRTHLRPTGCYRCNPTKHSKKQILCLDFLASYHNIHIQHAENGLGEFAIPSTRFKADGYCQATNTVYEFHGDLWHGNPRKFHPDNVSFFGVKYGDLYQRTLAREKDIRDLGYNLVVVWESEWDKLNRCVVLLQRKRSRIMMI